MAAAVVAPWPCSTAIGCAPLTLCAVPDLLLINWAKSSFCSAICFCCMSNNAVKALTTEGSTFLSPGISAASALAMLCPAPPTALLPAAAPEVIALPLTGAKAKQQAAGPEIRQSFVPEGPHKRTGHAGFSSVSWAFCSRPSSCQQATCRCV